MISDSIRELPVVASLLAGNGSAVTDAIQDRGELSLIIDPAQIVSVCRLLKTGQQKFIRLSGLTAVDRYPEEPRFEVVYLLHSLDRNERLRLKCHLSGEHPEIDSVFPIWKAADWYERETFDLFGIQFRGHPNLTRLMMPDGWKGHPLRKDYPLHGNRYSYIDE